MRHNDFIPALRFHQLTRFYDPVVRITSRELRLKQHLVAGLGAAPTTILDLGCGTGTLLTLVRERYPTADLVGLDADAEMLSRASDRLNTGARLVQGDATEPELPEGSFDRVISSLMFHHLTRDQKLRALRAVRALLSPGGEFHLADWGAAHGTLMRLAFVAVQLLDGFETTRDHVRGELPELMRRTGFSDVELTFRQRTPLGSQMVLKAHR